MMLVRQTLVDVNAHLDDGVVRHSSGAMARHIQPAMANCSEICVLVMFHHAFSFPWAIDCKARIGEGIKTILPGVNSIHWAAKFWAEGMFCTKEDFMFLCSHISFVAL